MEERKFENIVMQMSKNQSRDVLQLPSGLGSLHSSLDLNTSSHGLLPNVNFEKNSLEKKMQDMRERFKALQYVEDAEEGKEDQFVTDSQSVSPFPTTPSPANTTTTAGNVPPGEKAQRPQSASLAQKRWGKLRKVIRGSGDFSSSSKSLQVTKSPRIGEDELFVSTSPLTVRGEPETKEIPPDNLELEDIKLEEFWKRDNYFKPFAYESINTPDISVPALPPDLEKNFEAEIEPVKLEISRVPEEAVQQKKDTVEKALFSQQRVNVDTLRKLQTDVIWREDLARKRILELDEKTRREIRIEKQKMYELALDREKNMGNQFRRAREELEEGIKRQEAAIKEHFGRVITRNDSLARRFFVFTRLFPQPIEMRIHVMRAVKDKLPKGAYVMMLTQYDRLGGNPLVWSEIGATGIGKMRPGITRIVRHQGRYYDRVLRFEDSCYALCPPRPRIRPGNIFVLELFQLASHKNPVDKIVAWTAIPMSYESMSIINGKFKLPLLRGEHTPKFQHFREMEQAMGSDLSNWLCNVYIEIRLMSLHELGATEEMLKSANFDLDYFNKVVVPDSFLKGSEKQKLSIQTGSESHKSVIAKTPLAPFELLVPPSPSEKALFTRQDSQNEDPDAPDSVKNKIIEKEIADIENQIAKEEKSNKAAANKEGKEEGDHSEKPEEPSLLQLPADKGVFRRKVNVPAEIVKDLEGGGHENVNNNNTTSGITTADQEDEKKYQQPRGVFDRFLVAIGAREPKRISNFQRSAKVAGSSGAITASGVIVGNRSASNVSSNDLLTSNESFYEHKRQIIQQWKQNIKNKYPHLRGQLGKEQNFDKNELIDVRERGYHLEDEAFLHKYQRGKLGGIETIDSKDHRQWAAATIENDGKLIRKWQTDGPRFDSEAISGIERKSPRVGGLSPRGADISPANYNYSPTNTGKRRFFGGGEEEDTNPPKGEDDHFDNENRWEELKDPSEMLEYHMSISSDPTSRKNLIPGAISASKLRYLSLELFGDLVPTSFGTFDFYMTIILYLFCFWMRIYVHYLAQYLFILAQNTPIYGFDLRVLFIFFKYSSPSVSQAVEVGVVAIGPVANICFFLFLSVFGYLFYQFSGFLPDGFSKLFAYYGVATVLDPVLTLLVDLIYHHFNCGAVNEICYSNYTASDCACYNGDFIKLWYRSARSEGTGLTGAFITVMIYMGTGILAMLILHEYLLHVHRDGRILDLWRRINAPIEEFFLPDDYEVSAEELTRIITAAKEFKGILPGIVIKRSVVIHEGIEKDPNDPNFLGKYQRIIIYQNESTGKQFVYRHFLMYSNGKIVEIFNDMAKSDLVPKRAFQDLFKKVNGPEDNKDDTENNKDKDLSAIGNQLDDNASVVANASKNNSRANLMNNSNSNSNGNDESSIRSRSTNRSNRSPRQSPRQSPRRSPRGNDKEAGERVPPLGLQPKSSSTISDFNLPPKDSARSLGSRGSQGTNPIRLRVTSSPRDEDPDNHNRVPSLTNSATKANSNKTKAKEELLRPDKEEEGGGEPRDDELDFDLLPREEDYQHQEELIQQKKQQLHLDGHEDLDDEYYNQDHDEEDELMSQNSRTRPGGRPVADVEGEQLLQREQPKKPAAKKKVQRRHFGKFNKPAATAVEDAAQNK